MDVDGATQMAMMNAMDTTSLAFLTSDGIILASYSQLENDSSRIMELNPYTLFTMVGEPVDQLFWTQCELYKTQNQRVLPLEFASELLMDMMECYSGRGVSSNALIAGWEGESPILYSVDKDDEGCLSCHVHSFGPGKARLNHAIKIGYDYYMSICEAVPFARWAIDLAVGKRVASSVYYVGAYGWKKIMGDDVKLPPSPVTMNIEDQNISGDSKKEETSVKNWQAHLKSIEEIGYESNLNRMVGVCGSDLHAFNKWMKLTKNDVGKQAPLQIKRKKERSPRKCVFKED